MSSKETHLMDSRASKGRLKGNDDVGNQSSDTGDANAILGGSNFNQRGMKNGLGSNSSTRDPMSGHSGPRFEGCPPNIVANDRAVERSKANFDVLATSKRMMTDDQILIAFSHMVRTGNFSAVKIHQKYLEDHNQIEFMHNAHDLLVQDLQRRNTQVTQSSQINWDGGNRAQFIQTITGDVNSSERPILNKKCTASKSDDNVSSLLGVSNPFPIQAKALPGIPTGNQDNKQCLSIVNTTNPILPVPSIPETVPVNSVKTELQLSHAKHTRLRRIYTRIEEQPGQLFANNVPAVRDTYNHQISSLTVGLSSKLTARWILPLNYLRERALRLFEEKKTQNQGLSEFDPQNLTIRDSIKCLAVGLFRRGVCDNGSHSSIVSKEIIATSTENEATTRRTDSDFPFVIDKKTESIIGTVPFFSPKIPGNVIFRLYFDDEPHITLATGPCVHVIPKGDDYAAVFRFILSNFKAKKNSGISSIYSLASVLEVFSLGSRDQLTGNLYEEVGKVAWSCIYESRKVIEEVALSYTRKKRQVEDEMNELELADKSQEDLTLLAKLDLVVKVKTEMNISALTEEEVDKADSRKAKLMHENYNNERKWKEAQLVYSILLKAIINNSANQLLFKRDSLLKMRLEYELWCPLCESFAPNPFAVLLDEVSKLPFAPFPHPLKSGYTELCIDSRKQMQLNVLGFTPQFDPVSLVAAKSNKWRYNGRHFFHEFSMAIEKLHREEYSVSDKIHQRRDKVRAGIEQIVADSCAFPQGTKVAVFGSSANGFGSPNSDLDLCLQLPKTATNFSKEENGVNAMTKLSLSLTEAGMLDVDTVRLTARIPVLKFNYPYSENDETFLVECDLSFQNPLACLNTNLLKSYSTISPITCVLASIIKRWAKNREINNPSKYTLSSYGYVIMLLYYLTSSESTNDGFVINPEKSTSFTPILANLQWVDPIWAQNPNGPYREVPFKPNNKDCVVQHPTEPTFFVNTYFYSSKLESLQKFYSSGRSKQPCVGVLLASFFHYFAFIFDYKKYVVSLNKRHNELKEREIKAEEDGWSLLKHGLAIEDPFELFYDIAHVVKIPTFHCIRREFALAYSKIVNTAYNNATPLSGSDLIDLLCEPTSENK